MNTKEYTIQCCGEHIECDGNICRGCIIEQSRFYKDLSISKFCQLVKDSNESNPNYNNDKVIEIAEQYEDSLAAKVRNHSAYFTTFREFLLDRYPELCALYRSAQY